MKRDWKEREESMEKKRALEKRGREDSALNLNQFVFYSSVRWAVRLWENALWMSIIQQLKEHFTQKSIIGVAHNHPLFGCTCFEVALQQFYTSSFVYMTGGVLLSLSKHPCVYFCLWRTIFNLGNSRLCHSDVIRIAIYVCTCRKMVNCIKMKVDMGDQLRCA